jgi:3-oxoacyl-[acyl-carrier protein] reductase
MELDLRSRRALVTGAGSGIGLGIARTLAAEGARLAIVARNRARLDEAAAGIERIGGVRPLVISCHLATADGVAEVIGAVTREWGGVDILVNNAGGSRPLQSPDDEDVWQESMDLNFASMRRLANGFSKGMKDAGYGRILNLTGATVQKTMNAASPAKAALQSWSRSLAIELAPFGVTVNCIAPGRINSVQILERLHPTEESRRRYVEENIPAGRFGEPRDIANLVAFLASPCASYITGVTIPVDGGLLRLAL